MKKVFTIIAAIALSVGAFAQQVPNGSFETWTNGTTPDSWGTWGNVTGLFGATFPYFAVRDSSTYTDGHVSIKLITDTIPSMVGGQPSGNPTTPSLVGLGTMAFDFVSMRPGFSGIAYTKRPDSVFFSVKYAPVIPADSGEFLLNLTKGGTSLFGGLIGAKIPNTQGQWLSAGLALGSHYLSGVTGAPDTLRLFFASSTDVNSHDTTFGSILWVDAVRFDASVNIASGIDQLSGTVRGINAYPNPATDHINIAIEADEVGSQIQLFDMEGRNVYTGTLNNTTFAIDTKNMQAGVYSIRVNSIDKITTYKGKISIAK